MTTQGELFASEEPPAVPGLVLAHDAVTPAEEAELAARIDAAPLAPFQFGQWEGKRLTVHYGSAYDFTRHRLGEAPPLPDWLLKLRGKLAPQVERLVINAEWQAFIDDVFQGQAVPATANLSPAVSKFYS